MAQERVIKSGQQIRQFNHFVIIEISEKLKFMKLEPNENILKKQWKRYGKPTDTYAEKNKSKEESPTKASSQNQTLTTISHF